MEEMLIQLEDIEALLEDYGRRVDSLKSMKEELKAKVAAKMRASGIMTMKSPNNRVMVLISTTRSLRVDDENTVRTYLQSNGLYEECIRLDQATVKRYAKAREIPGMREEETETITVRQIKDKVEEFHPEESDAEFTSRVRESR